MGSRYCQINLKHTIDKTRIYLNNATVCRSDDIYSRYVGALCGLGCDKSGKSLFPENDIETTFDVQFTDEDIVAVSEKFQILFQHSV